MTKRRRVVALMLLIVLAAGLSMGLRVAQRRPTNERAWPPEQARIPRIRLHGDSIWIQNVRDFRWRSDSSFVAGWENRAYDLGRLRRVYFGLSPFARAWRGPAHTFLSFEFEGGEYLGVSVEARKQVGEAYSPLHGLLREYELMYVVAEERDLVGLRARAWRDPVYLYPGRASPAQVKLLFLRLMKRAHELEVHPEFYNTVTSNCTTNIVDAVNAIAPRHIRASYQLLFPGYSDELALRLGLLDTSLPLARAREQFRVDARARGAIGAPDAQAFSRQIRLVTAAAREPGATPATRNGS